MYRKMTQDSLRSRQIELMATSYEKMTLCCCNYIERPYFYQLFS